MKIETMLHALTGVSGDTALDIIETYQNSPAMQQEAVEIFERIRVLETALCTVTDELESWNLTEGDPEAVKAIAIGKAALNT